MGENVNVKRLLAKTLILLAILAFGLIPLIKDDLGKVSLYNLFVPGRYRFPYGENPDQSFNMSSKDASLENAEKKARELISKYREQAEIAMVDKKFTLLNVSPA